MVIVEPCVVFLKILEVICEPWVVIHGPFEVNRKPLMIIRKPFEVSHKLLMITRSPKKACLAQWPSRLFYFRHTTYATFFCCFLGRMCRCGFDPMRRQLGMIGLLLVVRQGCPNCSSVNRSNISAIIGHHRL